MSEYDYKHVNYESRMLTKTYYNPLGDSLVILGPCPKRHLVSSWKYPFRLYEVKQAF